ncbi:MAG: hypothetical protein D6705_07175 [Deltaproteobacteria bacterium]|nr:MAG: hypothetical protein D6705_07175 [Deltaproteobacteria bacterium]
MKSNLAISSVVFAGLFVATGCGDDGRQETSTTTLPTTGMTSVGPGGTESTATSTSTTGDTTIKFDSQQETTGGGGCNADLGCTDQIDLLFVIDNSGTMAEEQENLARNFPLLIKRLEELKDSEGNMVNPDVQIMVTTTDFGNQLCTQFQKHDPEKGAPITTGCNARIDRFTGLDPNNPVMVPEACTNVCPTDVVPSGDPFIHFWGPGQDENNIPDVPPADINGDGQDDSEVAQALACIGPQGIDGCGYESPLENMMQALNPGASWNQGSKPFLRDGALLAIVIVTDEADCSIKDPSVMTDPMFMETNPDNNMQQPTSAVCWNAGVTCTGPDMNGEYSNCTSANNDKLQPISRYTDFLIGYLRDTLKKEVIMLGILGVPKVTAHNPDPPFEPIAGGVMDLVYRDWKDGQYPMGDILPDEWANGVTAADKEFDFGIGPGCTGEDGMGGFTGQAIPPVRVKEVCEALNIDNGDGTTDVRCCIESICDTDFSAAIDCLTGIIGESIQIPG